MKSLAPKIFFFTIFIFSIFSAFPQRKEIDSLKKILETQSADTNRVYTLINLSDACHLYYPDSSLVGAKQALNLAEKLHFEPGIFWAEISLCESLMILGNYPMELKYAFMALSLSKKMNSPRATAVANAKMCGFYYSLGEFATSLHYWHEVSRIIYQWFPGEMWGIWEVFSRIYNDMNQHDSAMVFAKKAYVEIMSDKHELNADEISMVGSTYLSLGNAFAGKSQYDSALYYYHRGIPLAKTVFFELNVVDGYNGIATVYKATGKSDSAIWYAEKVLAGKVAKSYPIGSLKAANLLSEIYEIRNQSDSSLKYLKMAVGLKDSLFNRRKMLAIQDLTFKENEKQKALEASQFKLKSRYKMYFLLAGLSTLLVIAGIFLRNKRQKQLQKIRNGIADDLHDDIGSALSSISIMSELAKKKSPEAFSLLASIGESSATIQENMSDIVWTITSKNDRFDNVVQRMRLFSEEILEAKNIELDFTGDTSLSDTRLTMGQRKNCYLFFKEAINNAAKYSEAKKVTVRISKKERHIEMNISDNGKGFDTSKTYDGNGMNTFIKRASELNADLKIASTIGKGTDVQLKFRITTFS